MHAGASARHVLERAEFRPPRALAVITGSGFVLWAVCFGAFALRAAIGAPPEFRTFLAWFGAAVLFGLAFTFSYWTYALGSLAYEVRNDALVIRWGFRRIVIPLDSIIRIVPGRTIDVPHIQGLNWWGCHVGHGDVKRLGYTLFYSTHRAPEELVYIHTTEETYALAILDQVQFAEEVQARAAVSPLEAAHPQRSAVAGIGAVTVWRDKVALLMAGAAVLACAVMCGFVAARYPGLPDLIQLNFPSADGLVRVGDKSALLDLTYAGIGILVVNVAAGIVAHSRERAAGLWLFAAGGLLQVVLLGAAVAAVSAA